MGLLFYVDDDPGPATIGRSWLSRWNKLNLLSLGDVEACGAHDS